MSNDNEGFEKWFTEKYNDLQFNKGGMINSWNAAKADSEKEIERLKAQADLDESLMAESTRTIQELEAHINELREALEETTIRLDEINDIKQVKITGDIKCVQRNRELLKATPAQSLQAHDDEVIERCAKEVESLRDGMCIADIIRALKGKQNES